MACWRKGCSGGLAYFQFMREFHSVCNLESIIFYHRVQDLGIPVQAEWCIKAITGLRADGDVWKAMEYVRIMVVNNLSPDDLSLSRLVSAFSRIGQAQKATDLVRWGQVFPVYSMLYEPHATAYFLIHLS